MGNQGLIIANLLKAVQIGVLVLELIIILQVGKVLAEVALLLPQGQVVLVMTKAVVDVIVGEIMVVEDRHIDRTIVDLPRCFKSDNAFLGNAQAWIGVILVRRSVVLVLG